MRVGGRGEGRGRSSHCLVQQGGRGDEGGLTFWEVGAEQTHPEDKQKHL